MFTELFPGVFSVATRFVEGTNGIIVGERGALAVDVGFYADEGLATAEFIRSMGYEPKRVILTHGHSDHVLGGAAFAGAEVFAHKRTPAEMHRQLQTFAVKKDLQVELLLSQALWPTITFSNELLIDLGDKQIQMFPAPGHSLDHIAIYLPNERMLFAGDNVVTGIVPAIADGDSRLLEATLRHFLTLDIDVLVAGHGRPLIGAQAVCEWLLWVIDYLSGIRGVVHQALMDGLTQDIAADAVGFEQYVGTRLPADQHHMLRRHRDTVLKIATEEAERSERQL